MSHSLNSIWALCRKLDLDYNAAANRSNERSQQSRIRPDTSGAGDCANSPGTVAETLTRRARRDRE